MTNEKEHAGAAFNPAADPIPDEAEFRQASVEKDRMVFLNHKRTYDAYQDLDLVRARQASQHSDTVANLAEQALQNAVETANMISKQAVRHGDIAIDRQWNINETDQIAGIVAKALDNSVPLRATDAAVAKSTDTSVQIQAIAAAVAVAVAEVLNK